MTDPWSLQIQYFQSTQNISFKGKTTKEILNEIIWQLSVKMGYTNKM